MKKLFLVMTIVLMFTNKSYCVEIIDIDNHWAKDEIIKSIENDIIDGYEDKTFKPNMNVTVAEYLKMLITSAKYVLVKEGNTYWPDYYISTAKEHGLILENEYTEYNKVLTRNEIARITARYINVKDVNTTKIDIKDLEKEYEQEIKKLVNLNVINGYEDKTFRGNNNVTRAEAVVLVNRATKARRELINKREYKINEEIKLTNSNSLAKVKGTFSSIRYEIKNDKIYIYDSGRYTKLQGYEINDKNLDIKKISKIIKKMVDEDSYTGVLYVPSSNQLNQLIIMRGENENLVDYSMFDFAFTYYEEKPYELQRISQTGTFSEECYMKIEIGKMWRDSSEFNQGNYIDGYKKEKLKECLKLEFGNNKVNEILKYMLEKYEQKISRQTAGIEEKEQKIFGKYVVNYYKKTDGNPVFYVSLK